MTRQPEILPGIETLLPMQQAVLRIAGRLADIRDAIVAGERSDTLDDRWYKAGWINSSELFEKVTKELSEEGETWSLPVPHQSNPPYIQLIWNGLGSDDIRIYDRSTFLYIFANSGRIDGLDPLFNEILTPDQFPIVASDRNGYSYQNY